MKIWAKIHLRDQNKKVNLISESLTNYLYEFGPINELARKYNISNSDLDTLTKHTSNRIAGILMLYLVKDYQRINDIVNKYNFNNNKYQYIIPEIEGYIKKEQ